jgi:hypothetical protein
MTYPLDSQDWSRPWHSVNDGYAALAQFASTKCLSEVDLAQHHQADVLLMDGPETVARNLFQQLVDMDWGYNLDPWSAEVGQLIRDPRSIQKGSGTCLDLALLFCAMAKDAGLRPYLAIATGLNGDHAFAVIDKSARAADQDIKHRAANANPRPMWAALDVKSVTVDDGLPMNELLTGAFDTVDVDSDLPASWLPIDPTDACRSTMQHLRSHNFEDTVRNATEHLRSFDQVVFIDVVRAHAHGYPELDPRPDAERPIIFRRVPTVVGYHEIPSRRALIEDLAQRSGYVVLAGDPGAGKSLAASLVATRAAGGAGWFLNSEDSGTLNVELAEAAMSQLGLDPMGLEGNDIKTFASRAFEILHSASARWVVVLDNANQPPADYGRLPVPGANQLVLITTTNTEAWTRWSDQQPIASLVDVMAPLSESEREAWPGAAGISDLPATPLLLNLTVRLAELEALPPGRDADSLVAAALGACDPAARDTALALSLIPPVPVAMTDVKQNPQEAPAAVVQLEELGLVQRIEGDRVVMHRLIRAAARKVLEDEIDGAAVADLLLNPFSARYFETAATIADLDEFAGLLERSNLPDKPKAECLAILGSFQERKNSKASATWFEMALDHLPPPDAVVDPRQAETTASCLQGVARAVFRSQSAEADEWREARERLAPVAAMARRFPDDTVVQVAASRADAMDALLRRKLAATIDDPSARRAELEKALQQLERSAARREELIPEVTADIDRSKFNIPGTLIGLAKASTAAEAGPLLDRAEAIYTYVYGVRVSRYRTRDSEEVITCVNGLGLVNYYRAVLLPAISVEERLDYLKTARDHATEAMRVRESLAWPGGISSDSLKSANVVAKTLLLLNDLAAKLHDTSGKSLAKPDAFDKLVREAGKEHELLVAALEET